MKAPVFKTGALLLTKHIWALALSLIISRYKQTVEIIITIKNINYETNYKKNKR